MRGVAQVAGALRESGNEEVGPLLDYANSPAGWDRCVAIADEAGAFGLVALDLAVAFQNPAPFDELVRAKRTTCQPG